MGRLLLLGAVGSPSSGQFQSAPQNSVWTHLAVISLTHLGPDASSACQRRSRAHRISLCRSKPPAADLPPAVCSVPGDGPLVRASYSRMRVLTAPAHSSRRGRPQRLLTAIFPGWSHGSGFSQLTEVSVTRKETPGSSSAGDEFDEQ